VTTSEARTSVYTNARYALDVLGNDLAGCLPFGSGQQRFILDNGKVGIAGNPPTYNAGANDHVGVAADRLIFRATTTVADTLQTVEVEYCLVAGSKAVDAPSGSLPGNNLTNGDPSKAQTVGINGPPRPLYTLIRRVRAYDPASGAYSLPAKDKQNNVVQDMEVCHYVISFNLEYYASNALFSNLQPSRCPSSAAWGAADGNDPLGNGQGANDGMNGGTAYRIPMIRITLVIVDDSAERQERTYPKVIMIPMG
jgi:hypothetical protein